MLDDPVFRRLFVTFVLTAAMTVLLTVLPMLVAVIFAQGWGRLGTLYRTILFIPVISWVVTGVVEADPRTQPRQPQHVARPLRVRVVAAQLARRRRARPVRDRRRRHLAADRAVRGHLLRRAAEHRPDAVRGCRVGGANGWQQLRSVTVPMLRPVTLLVITLNLLNGIKLFDVIWVMTEGGPINASQVLGTYMYVRLRQPRVARRRLRLGVEHGDPRPLPRRRFGADPPRPTLQCLTARCWSTGRVRREQQVDDAGATLGRPGSPGPLEAAARRGRSACGASRRVASAASAP